MKKKYRLSRAARMRKKTFEKTGLRSGPGGFRKPRWGVAAMTMKKSKQAEASVKPSATNRRLNKTQSKEEEQVKLKKEFDSAIIGHAYPAWNQWMEDGWEAIVYDICKVDDILMKQHPDELADMNDVMRDLREVPVGKRPIFVDTRFRS